MYQNRAAFAPFVIYTLLYCFLSRKPRLAIKWTFSDQLADMSVHHIHFNRGTKRPTQPSLSHTVNTIKSKPSQIHAHPQRRLDQSFLQKCLVLLPTRKEQKGAKKAQD